MKAWHFLREDKKLGYDDGRLVHVGHTFKCDPDKIELCESGFHASRDIMDALHHAPGLIVCRVEMDGRILESDDKVVASERTVIAMADAAELLHEFACWCAERALSRFDNPDPRSIAAIKAKRKWLKGEISDAELEAAREAAWAAWEVARAAARAAAWDAAWVAARAAARAAAWDAAWVAARAAAWDAAWVAARAAAWEVARAAARAAAWDAAWVAARAAGRAAGREAERKAQSRKLTTMINEVLA